MALAERQRIVPMQLIELFWTCRVGSGIRSGTLFVFAPDADTAIATVGAYPDRFGLTENPLVGHPTHHIPRGGILGPEFP